MSTPFEDSGRATQLATLGSAVTTDINPEGVGQSPRLFGFLCNPFRVGPSVA